MTHLRQLVLILCGCLVLQPCTAMKAQSQTLPGEPAPPAGSDTRHLSTEEELNTAIDWAKFGNQPDGNKAIDTAIAAMTVGYPPAGIALGFIKGLITAGGPDPVGEALKAINAHLAEIDQRLDKLELEVKAIRNQQFQDENLARIRYLRRLGKDVQDGNNQLLQWPTGNFEKTTIANQAGTTVALFLDDPDLWNWSDLHVFTDQKTGQLASDMLRADYKTLPTFEYYASALVLWMSAIEYASNDNPAYVTGNKTLVNNLLKHAAFLSIRPTWHEADSLSTPDPPQNLPEEIMRRINCYVEPVSKYPTNGVCNARQVCEDVMRRTRTQVATVQFSMPSNNTLCTLSMPRPKAVPAYDESRPLYGSNAMALWQSWRAPVAVAKEDELQQSYGIEAMTLLADELERLARFGTTREQLIGTFDPTTYSQEFLYAVKPNGELLWYRDLIGTKPKGAPEPRKLDPRLRASAAGMAQPAAEPNRRISPASKAAATASAAQPRVDLGSAASTANRKVSATEARVDNGQQFTHSLEGPKFIGSGWQQFRDVIPAGLSGIYALTQDGTLKWYSHDGSLDGSAKFTGPVQVGTGWNSFVKIVPAGDGVLYGITPDGILRWYRHDGYKNAAGGAGEWSTPINVGSGWKFKDVFSGGEGILYAITADGKLLWYRHKAYLNAVAMPTGAPSGMIGAAQRSAWANSWEGPKDVGTGWQNFKKIFSPGDGMIYALKSNGDLLWYKHLGYKDGSVSWQGPVQIAAGWQDFLYVFPRMTGTWTPPVVR